MWQRNGRRRKFPVAHSGAKPGSIVRMTNSRRSGPRRGPSMSWRRMSIRSFHAVSLSFGLLCALCVPAGCGRGDRGDGSSAVPLPNPSAQAESTATASGDRQPVAPASSNPIDQTEEGAVYRQAVAALDVGDVQRALAARRRLEGHPQYSVLAEAVDAIALVKKGEYDEAMRAAERLSKIPAMQAESCTIAGEIFQAQGKWKQAIGAFLGALELHPELTRAHRWLGAIYHDTGAMHLASYHLRKVAELDPTDFRSLRLCGLIQYEYEKYDDAINDYSQALERSPPERMATEIRLELADSLRELRRVRRSVGNARGMRGLCGSACGVRHL